MTAPGGSAVLPGARGTATGRADDEAFGEGAALAGVVAVVATCVISPSDAEDDVALDDESVFVVFEHATNSMSTTAPRRCICEA